MRKSCCESSYTVNLAVLDGREIVYGDRARSYRAEEKIDLGLASGSRLPACCTAMGMWCLRVPMGSRPNSLHAEADKTRPEHDHQ